MKNLVEPSTISRSQSEASSTNAKSKLFLGTTTKFDSLFSLLDQLCLNSRLPNIIYYIGEFYLYYQVIFSSFYPFNKYWLELYESSNSKLISALSYLESIAWFFHVEDDEIDLNRGRNNGDTNLLYPGLASLIIFIISTIVILIVIFGSSRHHKLRKFLFLVVRVIIDIISPVMVIPLSSIIGNSIRNLVLSSNKANWAYLFIGLIIYIIFLVYTFVGYMLLNSSNCISMTLLSSFNIKLVLFLPTISSIFVILQCVFSLFDGWAMIIVQLTHILVGVFIFYQMYYLVFHSEVGNVIFIGVTLSTWINDIGYTILYFIPTPKSNGNNGFYLAGFLIPLISLVLSFVGSFLFVHFKQKSIVKQLLEIPNLNSKEGDDEQVDDNPHKFDLFKSEDLTLMALHISFIEALPTFYNFIVLEYVAARCSTKLVLINVVQLLSFFPGESRKLNNYLKVISNNRELNYYQRFLIFQIFRMKMLRQSSVSSDANHRLAELKSMSNQCCEDIISFWGSQNANASFLEMIADETKKVNMKWDECIRDFPNNQKFSDEYCSYLIECQMDLQRALIMKYRSNFIEVGKNFTIDVPFIRLAMCLPIYLKNRIVDYQGVIRHVQRENGNSNPNLSVSGTQNSTASSANNLSNNSNSSMSNSFSLSNLSSMNLDQDLEENLARQLFRQMNLRLEMHRALSERKSYASKLILASAYVILIFGFVFSFIVFEYSSNYIDYRSDSCYYLNLASKTSSYLDLSILGSTLKFAYFSKRFTTLDKFNDLDEEDEHLTDTDGNRIIYGECLFEVDDMISYNFIHANSKLSRDYFQDFLVALSNLANLYDENIYEFGYLLMHNEVPYISCFDGFPTSPVLTSIKALEAYLFLVVEQTAYKEVEEDTWYNSNEVCEILANQPIFHSNMLSLFSSLINHEIKQCKDETNTIFILQIVLPVVIFLVEFVPVIIFTLLFTKDTNKMIKILMGVNPQVKEEAKKPIRKDNFFDISQTTEKKLKNNHWILWKLLIFILSAGSAVIIFFMLYETDILNGQIEDMVKWNLLAANRLACPIETINYVINAIILSSPSSLNISSLNNISTKEKMLADARLGLAQLANSNEALLKGSDKTKPCYEFDDELDSLNFNSVCVAESSNASDLHESYRCCSISTSIGIFITMVKNIIDDIESSGGNLNHEMLPHVLHLLNNHLFRRLEQTVDRLTAINEEHCKSLESQTVIIFIVGIVVTIILFFAILYFYNKTVSIYHVGMVLTQRLPPNAFISDKRLLNFVLNRKDTQDESEMSTSQSAIYMSLDAIVCTNVSGVVEIINPAVTNTLGYTPDQMLGQHISSIFSNYTDGVSSNNAQTPPANNNGDNNNNANNNNNDNKSAGDAEKITNQLQLMSNGQCALVYEDHFICMTDDAKEMPCGVTILGMTSGKNESDGSNSGSSKGAKVESFVVILRDETQLVQQQREAEAAKAQSENLLYQILPRDIVVRLNSGEKDISFTVQSASIIFTDVVRFSEYASNLSPQEIMGSLSTLFAAFDTCAKHYELITKIKLIGDIYMAAAGLFSKESIPPNAHAEEILKFALECLAELDAVNMKLNANLQLRIGINSGGPLLAGVLGTDKPVFDIIGDPINVAARLQTTDIPGKIQIPQSTYDLVHDGPYTIEERGEVFLKGKGKTMSYLVSPTIAANDSFFSASSQKLV
ncbi:hypothetical protein M9Y10_005815 [Tritrichomonas musculus]|uniref:Adenylate and Guanylate cyclase catalytic domain containing protein n=1 Tax=Tritrichomonas musculus TaxID=1915356 RepID=A0ABR2GJT8_9EUKA